MNQSRHSIRLGLPWKSASHFERTKGGAIRRDDPKFYVAGVGGAKNPCETREKTSKLKVQWIWKRIVQCILGISWRFVLDYRNDGSLISYVSHMFYITDSIMYTSRLMRMARIGVVVILVDDDMLVA